MSHALLLRLFLSPSFFSVNVALQYLILYSENIGITYYLTRRLAALPDHELQDHWGFICHLLISRPSRSRALECFVMDMVEKSSHLALLTLWYMQSYLNDKILSDTSGAQFSTCHRVLQRCHEVIYGDVIEIEHSPYSSSLPIFKMRSYKKPVKPNFGPALVGVGCILAGPAHPSLIHPSGDVVIEQGRADVSWTDIETSDSGSNGTSTVTPAPDSKWNKKESPQANEPAPLGAQTSPSLLLSKSLRAKRKLSYDPFGQNDVEQPPSTPSKSTPSLQHSQDWKTMSLDDSLLSRCDQPLQAKVLQQNYYRTEVQFISALENISNRVVAVPKPARVSALRAELTSLNHKLPAEVCMPMWCGHPEVVGDRGISTSDASVHHRIVRIPPGECVVLNSATRAPYLLLIEVLHDDLDFDTSKYANKSIVKRVLRKERNVTFTSKGSLDKSPGRNSSISRLDNLNPSHDDSFGDQHALSEPLIYEESEDNTLADEEMDLVEQLYGADLSARPDVNNLESMIIPPMPKNRHLDVVTWSSSASLPSSPILTPTSSISTGPATEINGELSTSNRADDSRSTPRVLSLDDYSERMRMAAIMLAQLNSSLIDDTPGRSPGDGAKSQEEQENSAQDTSSTQGLSTGPTHPSLALTTHILSKSRFWGSHQKLKLRPSEAGAIRDRIMQEMIALEKERTERMQGNTTATTMSIMDSAKGATTEDEAIIRRELSQVDPSAVIFRESWSAKKSRIRHNSPYGHLASWDCISVIVKTGDDLRQELLAVQLIREFQRIWQEENCQCWAKYFKILITGSSSGLVETITDAVSIHSIKKAEYARRISKGEFGHVSLLDHFISTYGDRSSSKFARAQRNFMRSLAGYSVITYLLQIKDRHNGNILIDRDGHLIHIDFGYMLSNSPGNIGFEAAPFKLPFEYVEILGSLDGDLFKEFRQLILQGFETARKHAERIIAIVSLMQKDSSLPCFAALGSQTAQQLKDRFQPILSQPQIAEFVDRLIMTSLGSHWTRLYDSYQYYTQSIL